MADNKKGNNDGGGNTGGSSAKPGEKEAKGIVVQLIRKLLSPLEGVVPEKHLNFLLSIFNPFLGDTAQAAATKLKRVLGNPDWLGSTAVGSILGPIAAKIEEAARGEAEPTRVFLVKASDWCEEFASALRRDGDDPSDSKSSGKSSGKTTDSFEPVKAARLKDQQERLAKATPAEATALRKKILDDSEALAKSEKFMRSGVQEPKVPGTPLSEQFGEVLGRVNTSLTRNLTQVNQSLERRTNRRNSEIDTDLAEQKRKEGVHRKVNGEPFLTKVRKVILGF